MKRLGDLGAVFALYAVQAGIVLIAIVGIVGALFIADALSLPGWAGQLLALFLFYCGIWAVMRSLRWS